VEDLPIVRYCKATDGVTLARHEIGNGSLNLLWPGGGGPPVDLLMEEPGFLKCAERLGRISRAAFCDARGAGASGGNFVDRYRDDIVTGDLLAWLDALGFDQAVLVGFREMGPQSIRFTTEHPDRVAALVSIDTFAHYIREPRYPVGIPPENLERYLSWVSDRWGTRSFRFWPSKEADAGFQEKLARHQRLGGSPDHAAEVVRLSWQQDVRSLLGAVSVPTLILHRTGSPVLRVEAGRYLASHIPGARYVELPGEDFMFYHGDVDALVDEVEEFLTGAHQGPEGEVITSTVMFTDIVASTEQTAKVGHRKWMELSEAHDAMVRSVLQRRRGARSKLSVTGSSPSSTPPRAPFGRQQRSSKRQEVLAWRYGLAFTPARSKSGPATLWACQ
jgi:pimeloyl-ACP methyl ester carboxylesterase